jgi:hypothetical protein
VGFATTIESGVTFEKSNGLYTAKPGVMCTTRESYATIFMNDLDRAQNMIRSNDNEAVTKFLTEKRMIWTKAGVAVYVEERINNNIKVRPKGQTEALWMPAHGVDCAGERNRNNRSLLRYTWIPGC